MRRLQKQRCQRMGERVDFRLQAGNLILVELLLNLKKL